MEEENNSNNNNNNCCSFLDSSDSDSLNKEEIINSYKKPKVTFNISSDKSYETQSVMSSRSQNKVSSLKKILFWICGIESMQKAKETTEVPHSQRHDIDTSIDQDKFWAKICNINAVIALALSAFFFAFFNKYD
jgi:lipopolysaccharide export LptBFGC system permease protein LptF